MAQVKITKIRSVIKRPKNQKLTMEALGLRKMGSSTVVENTPQIRGMITVVRHLIKVEEV
ncbi:MAG: 50S ribosomal protein L30 [Rhodothermia bacterium]|nr:50S ribosomal protein L30 [Rhodothermia bacterium]